MRRRTFALASIIAVSLLLLAPNAAAAGGPWVFAPQAASAHSPAGRVFGAAAGAVDGRSAIFYGGQVPGNTNQQAFADTWVNSSAGWTPKCGTPVAGATAPCGPGPRVGQGMATAPNGVLLYGGFAGQLGNSAPAADMWRWTGTAWTQACTNCAPGARAIFAMTGNGTRAVLYGGLGPQGQLDDTWVYDGTSWTQTCGPTLATACGPGGLAGASMAWDGAHFVLFGGTPAVDGNSTPVADTWVFDGTKWTKACGSAPATACGPPARVFGAFAYAHDNPGGISGAVLAEGGDLFGGGPNVTLYRDAWLWRNGAWTRLDAPWSGDPVVFPGESGGPPPGSDPLIGLLAAEPGRCGLVYLGTEPTGTQNPAVDYAGVTFDGGRNRTGTGQVSGCAVPRPTSSAASSSSSARSSSTAAASTTTQVTSRTPQAGPTVASTGPGDVKVLTSIAIGLLLAGAAMLVLARSREPRQRPAHAVDRRRSGG